METLGRWSFALYLVHFPVLLGFQRAGAHGVVGAAAALIVAIALSGVLHACFERPVERWLRGSWGLAPSRGRPGVATDPASAA